MEVEKSNKGLTSSHELEQLIYAANNQQLCKEWK
jgi:hypothetical protein